MDPNVPAEDDDEIDIALRSPAEVAERCIILAALIRRLSIEALAETVADEHLAGEAFDIRSWIQTEGLWERLTGFEIAFLDRPVGLLEDADMAAMAWQVEGLVAVGWALGLTNLPDLGDLNSVESIVKSVPGPWAKIGPWLRSTSPQAEIEIARERDRAEILVWRIQIETPRRRATGLEERDYTRAIADVVREATSAGLMAEADQRDFSIGSRAVTAHDDEEIERLTALAEERLRALNWLCGFGDSWDRVALDV